LSLPRILAPRWALHVDFNSDERETAAFRLSRHQAESDLPVGVLIDVPRQEPRKRAESSGLAAPSYHDDNKEKSP
jgi:hypothetical protein